MHNPTPGLPAFDYIKPASLREASQFLTAHGDTARPFMGGTDTFVRMRDGFWREKHLVDVKHLDGMNAITFDPETGLTMGAAVNMNRVIASPEVNAHYPLLGQAARTVASYQLRSRATIVGNICNGSPAGDTTGACIVLHGVLHVHGVDGPRTESLDNFFLGPGETVLQPGDIVTAISFPLPPQPWAGTLHQAGTQCVGRPRDCRRDGVRVSRRDSGIRLSFPLGTSVGGSRSIPSRSRRDDSGGKPHRREHNRRDCSGGDGRRHAHQRHSRQRPLS